MFFVTIKWKYDTVTVTSPLFQLPAVKCFYYCLIVTVNMEEVWKLAAEFQALQLATAKQKHQA